MKVSADIRYRRRLYFKTEKYILNFSILQVLNFLISMKSLLYQAR